MKVALAIKFALNWLAGPQCAGGVRVRADQAGHSDATRVQNSQ